MSAVVNIGRTIDTLRLTAPGAGAVSRGLLGALAVTAAAFYWGTGASAAWAAGAAATTGAIALRDSPGGRVPVVLTVSAQLGLAVLLGTLTASVSSLFVAVTALWGLAVGLQWAFGSNAGLVGAAATGLLVIAPPEPPTVFGVLAATSATVVAGLVQAGLIAVWPPQRWRLRREALTRAYRSLADDARSVADHRDAQMASAPLTWLREAFVDSQVTQRPRAYHGGYSLPERITASLSALRAESGDVDGVAPVLTAAATLLEAVADHGPTARRDAEHALARVDAAVAAVTGPESALTQRFSQQLHEAVALRFGQFRRPDVVSSLAAAPKVVRGHLIWSSPILRHAARLAACVAGAVAIARFGPLGDAGLWIALAALMVLRPETAHTYTRCVGRISGIGAGILIAAIVTLLWEPAGVGAALCAAALLGLSYAVSGFGYIAISATLSAALVFVLGIDGGAHAAGVGDRLLAVAVGGGLAVVAHVVLPDPPLVRLRQRAGELLKGEIDYAATVIKASVHDVDRPAAALSASWQRAYRARTAFEAASGTTRIDSRELRRWLRSYRAALNAVTSACATLESSLPSQTTATLSREFVAAVDDYIDVLRGEQPTPARPWTLDTEQLAAANQKVREAGGALPRESASARVLVSELGAITRQLALITAEDQVIVIAAHQGHRGPTWAE